MVEDGRGGKLDDTGKVLILQIVSRVKAAAGEDGVLDAGGQEVSESHFPIEVIQFLQHTVLRIIGEVLQMVPVNLIRGAFGLLHERPAYIFFLRGTVPALQCRCDNGVVILP